MTMVAGDVLLSDVLWLDDRSDVAWREGVMTVAFRDTTFTVNKR